MSTPNVLPTISQLNPPARFAGSPAFDLTITGANLVRGSVVHWNGSPRQTIFVSTTQLQAVISAFDVAATGKADVVVCNPEPGSGFSNKLSFAITPPAPVLARLSPTSTPAGGPAFTLTVFGENFIPTSVVRWNGKPRQTNFISATQLKAVILAADVERPGIASVTVLNRVSQPVTYDSSTVSQDCFKSSGPAPGDSVSNVLFFASTSNNVVMVSAARMGGTQVAPESIALISGTGLASMSEDAIPAGTPQNALAGRMVIIFDAGGPNIAPLFSVHDDLRDTLKLLIPSVAALGPMFVQVRNGTTDLATVTNVVANVAPGLFSADESGTGLAFATVERNRNGTISYETVSPTPLDLNPATDQVTLILRGTGIRFHTSPVTAEFAVVSGGLVLPPVSAVVATDPDMEGRDLVRVLIPNNLGGQGLVNVTLTVDGQQTNTVQINIG